MREIVNEHMTQKEILDNSLPGSIVVGPFHLSVEGVRQNLSKKCKALATSMLDLLAQNLHNQVEDVSFIIGPHHLGEKYFCSYFEKFTVARKQENIFSCSHNNIS